MSETEAAAARPDLRPLVLGGVAWGSMAVAVSDDVTATRVLGCFVGLVALVAVRRSQAFLGAVAVLAAACVITGSARVVAQAGDPLTRLAEERATATVQVRLSGQGHLWAASGKRPALWRGTGVLTALDSRGRGWTSGSVVTVLATGDDAAAWARVPLGAVVEASVRLQPADPGTASYAEVRARASPRVVAEPDVVSSAVGHLRSGLVRACAPLTPDARALVPALVVGDTSAMTDDLRDRFVDTGLTHLTAVSGANLTLLLGFLRALAVGVGLRGRALKSLLVAGVGAFVVLCLGEPSVVRAAAMGLVGLAALGRAGRGRQGLRFLATAVIVVVLAEPHMARSLGFTLSVLATFGLLWWAGDWAGRLARWMPRWCAESLAVPLAAQVATEPVVVVLAGQVSVVSVLANLVSGPLVGPATVLGLVATLLAPMVMPLAIGSAWLAGWCAQAIAWTARLFALLPGARVPWPAGPLQIGIVVAACALAVVLIPRLLVRRALVVVVVTLVILALLRTPTPPGWPPARWAVAFCDVGQGDATVIRAGPGQAIVVDSGPSPGALAGCLDQLGVRQVPMVVLTHLHADHASGVDALRDRGVQLVVTSVVDSPVAASRRVDALFSGRRTRAAPGGAWQVGEARVEVLAAPALGPVDLQSEGESSAENDASLLLRVESGGVSVLLAGDAEDGSQAAHTALGSAIDVDVLLVPHHGSGRHSPAFVAATRPDLAVVSVGEDNDYGHPSARTLRSLGATGAQVVRTDQQGAIAVGRSTDGVLLVTRQK